MLAGRVEPIAICALVDGPSDDCSTIGPHVNLLPSTTNMVVVDGVVCAAQHGGNPVVIVVWGRGHLPAEAIRRAAKFGSGSTQSSMQD